MGDIIIVFDTNVVYNKTSDLFSSLRPQEEFSDFLTFIDKKSLRDKCALYVSEMTIHEIMKQKKELIKNRKDNLEKELKFFGLSQNIPELDVESQVNTFISSNNIKTLEYPTSLNKIIERAKEKKNPFRCVNANSDVGFKDVILWESVLSKDLISIGTKKVIFFTGDTDFKEDQLKPEFSANFNGCEIIFMKRIQQDKDSFQPLKTEIINYFPELLAEELLERSDSEIRRFIEEQYYPQQITVINHRCRIDTCATNVVLVTSTIQVDSNTIEFQYFFDIQEKEPYRLDEAS